MASSKINDNVVWVCNGHSDSCHFYALDPKGKYIAGYLLKARFQRNWEDMSCGPGPDPSKSYIYISDIGDNDSQWAVKTIYRFVEPVVKPTTMGTFDTIKTFDKLDYSYPDGIHDAEAMIIDPLTKDYYILSKERERSRIYKASFPQPLNVVDTLEYLDSIPYRMVTSADVSNAGDEILVKEYHRISYWKRNLGESIVQTLIRPTKQRVTYIMEKAGEAVCWSKNADGYFTISEELDSVECKLYHYVRNASEVKLNNFKQEKNVNSRKHILSFHKMNDKSADVFSNSYTISGKRVYNNKCATEFIIK
jgi:hypothetical protein